MKPWLAALWILTLAAAFGLARWTGPGRDGTPPTLDSFRAGLQESDPHERAYRVSAFLRQLSPDGLPAAVEAFEAAQPTVTEEEVRLFMLVWTRTEGPAALAWARAWPKPGWRQTLMAEALRGWAGQDGRAALAAVEALEDLPGDGEILLRQAVIDGWMRSSDKQGISDYIAGIRDPQRSRRLTFLLAGTTAKEGGHEAVVRWVEALPDDAPNDFKQSAFYHAVGTLARADPGVATAWLESHRTKPYTVGGLQAIALKWARHHDPVQLFDWLLSLPPLGEREPERADAISSGFHVWVRAAPDEAEAWLRSAMPNPMLDPATRVLVRALVASSPSSAMEWSQQIQDETLRLEQTRIASVVWQRRNPEAFHDWLATSDLPEELQQSLLQAALPVPRRRAAAAENDSEPGEPGDPR